MTPPTGLDSLVVRQAYFRKCHARHFGAWCALAGWVILGAAVSCFFILGTTGLGH